MQTIYAPKGAAKEYGDLALNIYTGCPHGCFYCYAPKVLRRDKAAFHKNVTPRAKVVEETARYIKTHRLTGKTVHLCFTCDPYPTGYDDTATREIIKCLKGAGNHVQILTKGSGVRDFDLLDDMDWYGVTLDGSGTREGELMADLKAAHDRGVRTWVSFEPVVDAGRVLSEIIEVAGFVDRVKIGKLNYFTSDIDWRSFGRAAEALCKRLGVDYTIKESLRKMM